MKSVLSYLVVLFLVQTLYAQSSEFSGEHLQGGEDAASENAIANFKSTPVVQGFRICIYSGSDQDARSQAKEAMELCYSSFEDIDGEIVYEAPIFKVLVGACVNRIEASKLLARLKSSFPKAFIMSSAITISDFIPSESSTDKTMQ